MKLIAQTEINIEGNYVKGKIINGSFKSENLTVKKPQDSKGYRLHQIKEAIEELEELYKMVDACMTAEKLSK